MEQKKARNKRILQAFKNGKTKAEIARLFKLKHTTVSNIITRGLLEEVSY